MPITLGCTSCGKRFRARDESAGKRVKCPYCQAAVQVPTADEAASSAAPTAPLPGPGSGPIPTSAPRPAPPSRPPAAPVAAPGDWGALPTGPQSPPPPPPEPFPSPAARGSKERPKPARPEPPAKGKGGGGSKSPEQILAAGWLSVRRGLFWVQFALFWLSLIGFIGFGKLVYTRSGNELPKGEGWIKIDGYINTDDVNAIELSKTDEMNLLMYGLPVCIAGIALIFGRLVAGSAPRSSGARGLFACSALFGLFGFAGLLGSFLFDKLLMKEYYRYTWLAFLLLAPLAEFWFLTGLTACGLALKRPRAARAVGTVGFVAALTAFVVALGWELYVQYGRPELLPKLGADDLKLSEQAALMLGWLLIIGVYWRAVRNVRSAAKEFLNTIEDE